MVDYWDRGGDNLADHNYFCNSGSPSEEDQERNTNVGQTEGDGYLGIGTREEKVDRSENTHIDVDHRCEEEARRSTNSDTSKISEYVKVIEDDIDS